MFEENILFYGYYLVLSYSLYYY